KCSTAPRPFARFTADAAYSSPSGHGINSTPRRKPPDLIIVIASKMIAARIPHSRMPGISGTPDWVTAGGFDDFARLIAARLRGRRQRRRRAHRRMAGPRAAHPARRADALPGSVGRGRLLPRERVARKRRDAPVLGFRSPAYAAARMDCGMLSQVVRHKPSVDRSPERGGDFRGQPPVLLAGAPSRGPPRRHRRVDSIRLQLARLSLPRLPPRALRPPADH